MKYVIVQVSKYYVCITPAESGKAFVSSGKDRDAKRPDYEVTFREPLIVFLPESLRGQAWNFPRDLAEVVKMSMRNAKIDIKDVILCAECDQLISQEYQHTPAKDKYLRVFAENEAKGLVSDDISNYSLINCEYGSGGQKEEESTQLGANVYIMPKAYVEELKTAFREQSLTLYKLIPPTISTIKIAKTGINSFDKSVALISIDFCTVRLLVMQKGVPVYAHSFPLPLGDIANIFASDQNCTLEEAFEVIRKYGVGISEKCNSRQAGREMRQVFENISSEVIRNLRMVLLSLRIELDQIYASDFAAYIPGVLKHIRTVSVQADEINLISDAFTSLTNVPIITKETDEAGYKTACFYTYSYIVNSGAQNENNLAAITGSKSVDLGAATASLGNLAAMAFAAVAVGVMVFIGLRSYGLEVRKQQDQARLNDVKYDEIKGLLAEQLSLRNKMENAQKDIQALPHPNANVGDIMDQVFLQLTDKVEGVKKYKVNSDDNEIETTFYVKVLEDYNNLQEKIRANGFFSIKTSLKSKQAIMKVPIIEGSSEDGSDKDKDDKKSSDTDTEAEKTAETDTDTNTDTEAAETDTEKESDKKKRKKQEYNEVEVYEVTHTFTVEGLNNKTSGSDEEFDGHHTDISHGTNYDEMIESTMED